MNTKIILSLVILQTLFGLPVWASEQKINWNNPFPKIEKVIETEKSELKPSDNQNLSIPYSQIDIIVRNGIAFKRIVQTYYNHSDKNEGYALSVPNDLDTTISHFNIWDRGIRYVGAIEERTKAEEVYKTVTGDEAPRMNIDPGLVRQTPNRFEMRVFPIFPGELKQIELVSHQRLGFIDNKLSLPLQLRAILNSSDVRHPNISSKKTVLNISIEDELKIHTVDLTGSKASLQPRINKDHHKTYSLTFNQNEVNDGTLNISLALPETAIASVLTHGEEHKNFFLMRVVSPLNKEITKKEEVVDMVKLGAAMRPDKAELPEFPKPDQPPVYFGVWRGAESQKGFNNFEDLDLEIAGYNTFMLQNWKRYFHASWLTYQEGERLILSEKPYPIPAWMIPFGAGMQNFRGEMKNKKAPKNLAFDRALAHLRSAIEKDQTKEVFLFLADVGGSNFNELKKLIGKHSKARFLLISKTGSLLEQFNNIENVSLFSLETGWIKNRHFFENNNLMLSGYGFESIAAAAGIPFYTSKLKLLWEKLPELHKGAARCLASNNLKLEKLSYLSNNFTSANARRYRVESNSSHRLVWISGEYEGSGKSKFSMRLSNNMAAGFQGFGSTGNIDYSEFEVDALFPEMPDSLMFVASLQARIDAVELDAEIAQLTRMQTRAPLVEKAMLEGKKINLQKKLVKLSKKYGFITNETAFIALPDDLQKKHGITPQSYEVGNLYSKTMASDMTAVPEPSSVTLLLIALLVAGFFKFRKI